MQSESNKALNNGNGKNNIHNYSKNSSSGSNHFNTSSDDVGSKMISYSPVPSSTTTNRPKFSSYPFFNKQDLEGQMMLSATSSPIGSIVMPNKQHQIYQLQQKQQQQQQQQYHQQISPPTPSSTSNRNVALIFPNGPNFGASGGVSRGTSSVGNQIKLPTVSLPPDGRYLAAAAAATLTDQFGSSSLVSAPPFINNNSKESFIFDSSNNLLEKQSSTSSAGRNMADGTSGSSDSSPSLSHLFPSSKSFISSSAPIISTAASTPISAPLSTSVATLLPSKSISYPLSVIHPTTRVSLLEQLRRSPLLNKSIGAGVGAGATAGVGVGATAGATAGDGDGGGGQTKQPLSLSEFLITSSSSHQPNEFETTLKQQPEHQHEPIIQVQDGSSSIPISLDANSSELSSSPQHQPNVSFSTFPSIEDMGDDDEGSDNDATDSSEMTHGDFELKNEAVSNGQDQDGKPTRLDIKSQQQQQQQQQLQQLANEQSQNHQKPINTDTELLVGPFKSESEAPATITLSGVIYQKSGASSSFLRHTTRPEVNDKENLSTSGSQQASASTTNNNVNDSVSQLKPNSSHKIFDSSQLKGLKLEDLVNQSDKNWPYSSTSSSNIFHSPLTNSLSSTGPHHHQLGSINEILLGSLKSASEPSISMESFKDSTSGVGSSLFSSLQLPDSYMGLSGGIRLGPFPFSPASLLSNSLFGSGSHHLFSDLTAQKMLKGGTIEQQGKNLFLGK